jgi:hypothetical protein
VLVAISNVAGQRHVPAGHFQQSLALAGVAEFLCQSEDFFCTALVRSTHKHGPIPGSDYVEFYPERREPDSVPSSRDNFFIHTSILRLTHDRCRPGETARPNLRDVESHAGGG